MTTDELIKALERMKPETGSRSFCCLGCGHEHNCGVHGCAIIREAIKTVKLYQAKPPEAPKKKPIFKIEKMKCPFCEGENKNAEICENVRDKEYFVYCTRCGCETRESFASKTKAIKAFESGENRDIPKEKLK